MSNIHPHSRSEGLVQLAIRYQAEGRTQEASELVAQSIRSGNNSPDVLYFHVQLLLLSREIGEAKKRLKKLVAINPNHTWALNDLGVIHHQEGRMGKAIECFQQALKANIHNSNALSSLLSLLVEIGHSDQAERLAESVRKELPHDADIKAVVNHFHEQTSAHQATVRSRTDIGTTECIMNIVDEHLTQNDVHALHSGDIRTLWSQFPVEGSDIYAFLNASSYRENTGGFKVLLMLEPIVVLPGEFDEKIWRRFDHVLTLFEAVTTFTEFATLIDYPRSHFARPSEITENLDERERKYPLEGREPGLCMINGYKTSSVVSELYSSRIAAAKWFHQHSTLSFDVYGNPAFPLPNYKRGLSHGEKLLTLASYRYSLCFENTNHPVFSAGYVTEKIFDCLETRTVPIYLGCVNVEQRVPKKCFIDYRDFGSFEELDRYLTTMSDKEYQSYIDAIDGWVASGGLRPYSWLALYERLFSLWKNSAGRLRSSKLDHSGWSFGLPVSDSQRPWKLVQSPSVWNWIDLAKKHSPLLDADRGSMNGYLPQTRESDMNLEVSVTSRR
jgi:tetratricopeptide (TPR) repeat protein